MSDGVIITIDMVIKPEFAEQVIAGIPRMFEDTVRFEGFRSIRVVRHQHASNHLLIVEHWDTEAHYQAYQAWRNRGGDMDAAMELLQSYRYDAWPALVGSAGV
ncbi:MAG TPA: antibiotic biosynthesis monooxygenase family protein [Steroidobacteraceae bacterium]|jgi:quinol monooxygenase YgiN|nr:antibiotic biosynthesis monooxygenase family protein [Steroidobacteraceae bacterium]